MNMQEMIARINFLARKKRTEGLTEGELIEQKELYELYLGNIRAQVKQNWTALPLLIKNRRCSTDVYSWTRNHLLRRRIFACHQ